MYLPKSVYDQSEKAKISAFVMWDKPQSWETRLSFLHGMVGPRDTASLHKVIASLYS